MYRSVRSISGQIFLVVLGGTFCAILGAVGTSYFLSTSQIESLVLEQLKEYTAEKVARERELFKLAEENHILLKRAIEENLSTKSIKLQQSAREFGMLTERLSDGTVRSRKTRFNPLREAGIFVGKNTQLSLAEKHNIILIKDLVEKYGRGWTTRFQDTYVSFPNNSMVVYWPAAPKYIFDAASNYDLTRDEWFRIATPEHNPTRKTVWTGMFFDTVSKLFMVSAETPIDDPLSRKHLMTVGHDVMLDEFMARVLKSNTSDTHHVVIRSDGRLIAHEQFMDQLKEKQGVLSIQDMNSPSLNTMFAAISQPNPEGRYFNADTNEFFTYQAIPETGWYFFTTVSASAVKDRVANGLLILSVIALIVLGMTSGVAVLILRKSVVRPIKDLVMQVESTAKDRIFRKVKVDHARPSLEVGVLMQSYNRLIESLEERDQKLRDYTDNLEQHVSERTRELEAQTRELERSNAVIRDQQKIVTQSAKMSALGEMAGGIAHEINNPLAVVTARAEHIQRVLTGDAPKINKAIDFAKVIEQTAHRIAVIVAGLKSFSRSGDNDPVVPCSLNSVVSDTLALCSQKLKNNQVMLEVKGLWDGAVVLARPVQISQVLLNLISNSNHAVQTLQEKWICIEFTDLSQSIRISVTDSGAGIPEEIREKIMQPFFTTKGVGVGTGLGLSISRGIIEEHKGKFFLDTSNPHTSFVIELPKATENALSEAA